MEKEKKLPKLCECGCGKKTKIIKKDYNHLGLKKGDYNKYLRGHNKSLLGKHWKIKDASKMHHTAWDKGIPHTEEHKRHMRENHKGTLGKHWKLSEEAKKNMGKSKKGKHLSPSTEFKKGHKVSDGTRKMMRERRAKQVFPIKDTKIEQKIQTFLTKLHIEFFTHKYMNITHGYQCDIFIPSKNLVIECDGDYWHGNNKLFNDNQLSKRIIDGREMDKIRTKELIEKGFKVLRLWEHEINTINLNDFEWELKCQ